MKSTELFFKLIKFPVLISEDKDKEELAKIHKKYLEILFKNYNYNVCYPDVYIKDIYGKYKIIFNIYSPPLSYIQHVKYSVQLYETNRNFWGELGVETFIDNPELSIFTVEKHAIDAFNNYEKEKFDKRNSSLYVF